MKLERFGLVIEDIEKRVVNKAFGIDGSRHKYKIKVLNKENNKYMVSSFYGSIDDYEKKNNINENDLKLALFYFLNYAFAARLSFNEFHIEMGYDLKEAKAVYKGCQETLKGFESIGLTKERQQAILDVLHEEC